MSAVFVALFCIGFVACSSDDDGDDNGSNGSGKGSGTMKVKGREFSVDYGYFAIDAEAYNNHKEVYMNFCSWDYVSGYLNPTSVKSYPTTIHDLSITYDVDAAQTGIESVTIPGGSYHLYVATDVSENSEGWQAETKDGETSNSPLVIKKDGNTVTVTIEKANIYDYDDDGYVMRSPTSFSFTFKGPINRMPDELID